MNKGKWLEEFENKLLAEDWRFDENGEPVEPEYTVEEAFARYLVSKK